MGNSSINTFFTPSLHSYWGGGVSPPAPPLGMALNAGKTILEAKVKKANKD